MAFSLADIAIDRIRTKSGKPAGRRWLNRNRCKDPELFNRSRRRRVGESGASGFHLAHNNKLQITYNYKQGKLFTIFGFRVKSVSHGKCLAQKGKTPAFRTLSGGFFGGFRAFVGAVGFGFTFCGPFGFTPFYFG